MTFQPAVFCVTSYHSITLLWRTQGDIEFSKVSMTETEKGMYIGEISGYYTHANVEYYLQLHNSYYDWTSPVGAPDSLHSIQRTMTGIHEQTQESTDFELTRNPFNPKTTIKYTLPKPGNVRLAIYDLLGRQIRTLINNNQPAGRSQTSWNGTDDRNMPVAAGVYFCRMEANDFIKVIKLALMRQGN